MLILSQLLDEQQFQKVLGIWQGYLFNHILYLNEGYEERKWSTFGGACGG